MKKALIAYVVALHFLLGLMLWKSDFVDRACVNLGRCDQGLSHISMHQGLHRQRVAPQMVNGSSVFLGDSITESFDVSRFKAVNFGIGQQRIVHIAEFVRLTPELGRAGTIFLQAGTNDLGKLSLEQYRSSYRDLLSALPDGVPLVWSSLMPVSGNESTVISINKIIESECARRGQCTYVDVFTPMIDPTGKAVAGTLLDGVHPSAKGYAIWREALRPYVPPPAV